MRIKLFTHTDLDGVGCYIALADAFGESNIDVVFCDYHNVNERVEKFLNDPVEGYNIVLITDISVNENVAEMIDNQDSYEFMLLDHHKTAEDLNKYDWAYVVSSDSKGKTSGTSMVSDVFIGDKVTRSEAHLAFIETVRRYDTWEWSTIYNDEHAKQTNDLLDIYGRKDFIEMYLEKLQKGDMSFTGPQQLVLELRQREIDGYIKSKEKTMQVMIVDGLRVGLVFNERFSSEMGNVLSEKHPELDLIAMANIDRGTISLRTIHDDVDLSVFAKRYAGGGHPKAAGMPLFPRSKEMVAMMTFPVSIR